VKKLNSYNCDSKQVFDQIVSRKRGARRILLNGLVAQVKNRYDDFTNVVPNLENLNSVNFSLDHHEALCHCYGGSTEPLEQLKSRIKAHQDDITRPVCQYCGIGESSSTDHYLPKESFPEYSVLSSNLVPCCLACNSLKGTTFVEGGVRQIINLYFDHITDKKYLHVNVILDPARPWIVSAKFFLANNEGIDPNLFFLIESHYKHLNLLERYQEMANTYLIPKLDEFKNGPKLDRRTVRDLLAREVGLKRNSFGINYWQTAIADGLVNSNAFVAMLSFS
jgi:hypothetical protein